MVTFKNSHLLQGPLLAQRLSASQILYRKTQTPETVKASSRNCVGPEPKQSADEHDKDVVLRREAKSKGYAYSPIIKYKIKD